MMQCNFSAKIGPPALTLRRARKAAPPRSLRNAARSHRFCRVERSVLALRSCHNRQIGGLLVNASEAAASVVPAPGSGNGAEKSRDKTFFAERCHRSLAKDDKGRTIPASLTLRRSFMRGSIV